MSDDPNRLLTTQEAAQLLGLQPCTLCAWREDGSQPGLPHFKLGKAVRYRYGDLIAFVETRRASSTLLAKQLPQAAAPSPTPASATKAAPRRRKTPKSPIAVDRQQSLF